MAIARVPSSGWGVTFLSRLRIIRIVNSPSKRREAWAATEFEPFYTRFTCIRSQAKQSTAAYQYS